MSNDNTQFCTSLVLNTNEEARWWHNHLNVSREDVLKLRAEDLTCKEVSRFLAIMQYGMSDSDCYDFDYHIEGRCRAPGEFTSVTFSAEDSGEPWQVAQLVHYFFKDMRPATEDRFEITWARTNSRGEEDAFYGGTVFATKKGVAVCGVDEQRDWFEQQNLKPMEGMPE